MAYPPGPRQPALLQTVSWFRRPIAMLEECARRYGDFFTIRLLDVGPVAVLSHPDAIRDVFRLDPALYRVGEAAVILVPLVGERSVLVLDGAEHMRQRRLLLPPFHGERMKAYATAMREAALADVATWPVGAPFSIHPRFQHITLQVILRTVFGVEDARRMGELGDELKRLLAFGENTSLVRDRLIPGQPTMRAFMRQRARVDALIYAEIARRRERANARADDVMSLLMAAVDEDGSAMSDQEIRDELMTLLVAGHETTATSLAWTIERVLSHHAVYDRVRDELAGGANGEREGELPYLDAVIRESLRLRPVLPVVVRKLEVPMMIHGFALPAGATVAPSIYLAQRRPEIYPEPERFQPERFLGVKPNPYAWLPFGGSIRRCIGMAFALYEMRIVLAAVLSQVELGLAPGTSSRMTRRAITFAPSGGPEVVARRAAQA